MVIKASLSVPIWCNVWLPSYRIISLYITWDRNQNALQLEQQRHRYSSFMTQEPPCVLAQESCPHTFSLSLWCAAPTHLSEDNLKAFGLAGSLLPPLPGLAGHQGDVVALGDRQDKTSVKSVFHGLDSVVTAATKGVAAKRLGLRWSERLRRPGVFPWSWPRRRWCTSAWHRRRPPERKTRRCRRLARYFFTKCTL